MYLAREDIYNALFLKLKSAYQFKTATRRVRHWDAFKNEQGPVLVMIEEGETYEPEFTGEPTKVTLDVTAMVYFWVSGKIGDGPDAPISLLNPIVDALEAAIAPDPTTQAQTLGGVVNRVWIDGKILKSSGDQDNVAIAMIPIKMVVPA